MEIKITKKNSAFILIQILTLSYLTIFFTGCMNDVNEPQSVNKNTVMLLDSENKTLVQVEYADFDSINSKSDNEIIRYIIELLAKGVEGSKYESTIDDNIKLKQVSVLNSRVILDFTNEYYNQSAINELYMRSSIVRSITELDRFSSVEFYVESNPLKTGDSKMIGKLRKQDVLLTYDEATNRNEQQILTIYFPNEDNLLLVPTIVEVTASPNRKIEDIVIDQLISADKKLLPLGVELLNVYTHEGICFIDFSSEFKTSPLPQDISERIAIYAIVNSLVELTHISKVQILVNGKIEFVFQKNLSLNRIFIKNYSLIEF